MKEYVLTMQTPGGSRTTEVLTNKREAKSKAWKFIRHQKSICRDKGTRDYGELMAKVIRHCNDIDNNVEVIAYYD